MTAPLPTLALLLLVSCLAAVSAQTPLDQQPRIEAEATPFAGPFEGNATLVTNVSFTYRYFAPAGLAPDAEVRIELVSAPEWLTVTAAPASVVVPAPAPGASPPSTSPDQAATATGTFALTATRAAGSASDAAGTVTLRLVSPPNRLNRASETMLEVPVVPAPPPAPVTPAAVPDDGDARTIPGPGLVAAALALALIGVAARQKR